MADAEPNVFRFNEEDLFRNLRGDGDEPMFHDVVIRCGEDGAEIKAHRCMLAAVSPYFRTVFQRDAASADRKPMVEVDMRNYENIQADILRAVVNASYRVPVNLSDENVQDLHAVANFFGMETLAGACVAFMRERLSIRNVLRTWCYAQDTFEHSAALRTECMSMIGERRFADIADQTAFLDLRYDDVVRLVSESALTVRSENQVLDAVLNWFSSDWPERHAFLEQVLGCVRWAFIDFNRMRQLHSLQRLVHANFDSLPQSWAQNTLLRTVTMALCRDFDHELFKHGPDCTLPRTPPTVHRKMRLFWTETRQGSKFRTQVLDAETMSWGPINQVSYSSFTPSIGGCFSVSGIVLVLLSGFGQAHRELKIFELNDRKFEHQLTLALPQTMHTMAYSFQTTFTDGWLAISAVNRSRRSGIVDSVLIYDLREWAPTVQEPDTNAPRPPPPPAIEPAQVVQDIPDTVNIVEGGALVLAQGKVWFVGNCTDSRVIHCWDMDTREFTRGPNLMERRSVPSAVAHKDVIYVSGGVSPDDRSTTTEILKPGATQWKVLQQRNHSGRDHHLMRVADNKLCYVGGYLLPGASGMEFLDLHDPSAGWEPRPGLEDDVPRETRYTINGATF